MSVRPPTDPRPGARVAFITHYTELYGANLSLLNLIEGLSGHGVRAHVICPESGDLLGALERGGVPVAVLPFEWWVSTDRTADGVARRALRNVRRLRAVAAQLREWGTDLVYSNSSVFAIGAMAAAELDLPHVWHLREFGDRDYDLWPDLGPSLSRLVFRTADATVFVSHALKQAFLGNRKVRNSHVIYNGVGNEATFAERRRAADALRGRRQPFTFVLVGRFRESKGQAIAIRAFARLAERFPDTRLLLVGGSGATGDQAYFDECRALPARLGVADRVEFWGYIPDPERAFLAADAALMCSRNEAMGRVTAEAMSVCRPVIGYDSGGTSELIAPDRTGFLYKGGPDALAGCMARYVADPALARAHGEAGWELARSRHTTEGYAAQIHAVIAGVLGRG
ncbi:D-inositol 3-phosphate glycosyltransferase [Gemmata obscuriglobus]|uniref:Glycosyltransferase family 1 protein n=1 Tax=Gemmata obscuriglobus TaxID=114 RepID=A0A2Z3GPI4_9BACT|nr:glycosyltransferase family 4 protein [Gemmata obscuriglobus]AWM36199.1 glycosyltransferase family 1 protein [Gemmata obscuriglobus]QEG31207.1 D-inositol 3-phosphate glycosyltransferase [Gemmata obscuriglobus]VTS10545.1 group 1 glycosyl transferase : Glycosyltransferase OS=Syntrophus aciditrophicus (strain SB) GN=SYN_00823 PE=4 SV=1: Glyco_trans_4_4: Glycos_transf_1 [Gemmata obscuriglobus UQM 2246]